MWYWKMWNIGLYHAAVRDTIIFILCDYCWNCICLFYPVTHWEMIVWHPCKFWLGPWGCGYRAKSRLRRPGEESGGWDLKGVGTDEPERSQAFQLCIQYIYWTKFGFRFQERVLDRFSLFSLHLLAITQWTRERREDEGRWKNTKKEIGLIGCCVILPTNKETNQ